MIPMVAFTAALVLLVGVCTRPEDWYARFLAFLRSFRIHHG